MTRTPEIIWVARKKASRLVRPRNWKREKPYPARAPTTVERRAVTPETTMLFQK